MGVPILPTLPILNEINELRAHRSAHPGAHPAKKGVAPPGFCQPVTHNLSARDAHIPSSVTLAGDAKPHANPGSCHALTHSVTC